MFNLYTKVDYFVKWEERREIWVLLYSDYISYNQHVDDAATCESEYNLWARKAQPCVCCLVVQYTWWRVNVSKEQKRQKSVHSMIAST